MVRGGSNCFQQGTTCLRYSYFEVEPAIKHTNSFFEVNDFDELHELHQGTIFTAASLCAFWNCSALTGSRNRNVSNA